MSHALVIGGSGMLRGVSLKLTESYETVSVIARSSVKLASLQNASPRIKAISTDYCRSAKFLATIERSISLYGPVTMVVCWIHDTAPAMPRMLAERLSSYSVPLEFYHVLGSAFSR